MLQPFELFKPLYIDRLRKLKKKYLVTQTYLRATNPMINDVKTPLLITDYDDLGQARLHQNAVKHDKYAAIIDLEREDHVGKLNEMLTENSKFLLYWSVVKDVTILEKHINNLYKNNMRKYIDKNTNWRINRDVTIIPKLETTFGELFVTLKYGSQRIRLKFEEIERI